MISPQFEDKFQVHSPNEIKGVISKHVLNKHPSPIPRFKRERMVVSHRHSKKVENEFK